MSGREDLLEAVSAQLLEDLTSSSDVGSGIPSRGIRGRCLCSFLLGQLLLEAATRSADAGAVEETLHDGGAPIRNDHCGVDLTDAPVVHRLHPNLSEDHSAEEFENGLKTLLNRMQTELSQ